jgi:hypothetical protein
MDFPLHRRSSEPFPWRTAATVAAGIAAVELVLLFVVGGALLAKPTASTTTPSREKSTRQAAAGAPAAKARASAKSGATATKPKATAATTAAELPRRKVEVLVLNGNGRTGAAAAAASRVGRKGYQVKAVGNAPRQDYPQSIVLFRRGFEGEGQRLARDLGVHVVGPLDGMRTAQLHGAHVVFILGS